MPQTIAHRKAFQRERGKRLLSESPHCPVPVSHAAISKSPDLASGNRAQMDDRSLDQNGRDSESVRAMRGFLIGVAISVLFVWMPLLWWLWPNRS